LKTFKFLSVLLSLAAFLSACNLPGRSGSHTANQNQVGPLQVNPTQADMTIITPIYTATVIASPIFTPVLPDAPVWSVYNYTCELAVGGGTMTMNLGWTDRSDSEEGYRVYRDGKVIATLPSNSTSYVDVAFVATGKVLDYSVEAFNKDWRVSTSTITHGCQ